jgi:hypothetical protein
VAIHLIRDLQVILIVFSITSCAPKHSWEIEREPQKYQVEVDTIDELALKAVDDTKTDFFVPTFDDGAAWDRTKIFFVKYLNMPSLKNAVQKSGKASIVSNSNVENSPYRYEVKKELFGNGYNYFVKCKPANSSGTELQAQRNAKNLSRFINEGTLETTLLK